MKTRLLKTLIAACALLLASCTKNQPMPMADAHQWISAFAPECISPDSRIRIEITDSLRAHLADDVELDDAFCFSPKLKGEYGYADEGRYLDFHPAKGELREGKEYTCNLHLDKLTGIDSLGTFSFTFRVAKREVKMNEVSLRIDPKDVEHVIVSGQLVFSHAAGELSSDSRLLKCSEKNASVSISETADDCVLEFNVTGVERHEEDHPLVLQYDPGISSGKTEHIVMVPGLKEFGLLSASNNCTSEPYICLEFTAPLDPRQELDGLITLDRWGNPRIDRSGSTVKVYYPAGAVKTFNVCISDMIRSIDGRNLKAEIRQEFTQETIPPAIELPISGTILPDGNNLVFPFKAVNLAAVDVEVVKIFASNVMHYLQSNELDEIHNLRKSGRLIYRQTVRLDKDKSLNLHQWNNFSIDLKNLIKQERGAIYNIRLTFRKAYSLYDKVKVEDFEMSNGVTAKDDETWDIEYSYISRSAPDMNWDKYSWREADDPSKDSYYMVSGRMPECNILASDIGLIVKKADNKRLWTTVSDIMTAMPLQGIKVTAYNFQLQEVGSGWSNDKGFADFEVSGKPFIVTATDGDNISYLKVRDGMEKSTSNFNVSGKQATAGIKGYTYGERGIWRPGDDIHLTLIVEDKHRTLPSNHPVRMRLYTPDNVLYNDQTLTNGIGGFYSFRIKTADDVKTGKWYAHFDVGNNRFTHTVPIETIKPNRLKINIDIPETVVAQNDVQVGVNAQWLTGVTAGNLNTVIEAVLYKNDKPFKDLTQYTFSNPLMSFSQSKVELGKGALDSLGHATLNISMPKEDNAPGMLQANIICRVAESGGSESMTSKSVRYSPFDTYVGIDLKDGIYETDSDLRFPVVAVNPDGLKAGKQELEWKIYKLGWSWWWEGNSEDLNRYVSGKSADVVASGTLTTSAGKAELPFRLDYPDWGRFLIIIKDKKGGHTTGGVVTIDWPQWRGRSNKSASEGASILSFTLDKQKYEVGQTATVFLPKAQGGRVLISIENGAKVLSRHWVSTSASQETAYKMTVTKSMAPNFYVHATLLQPHKQSLNDLPIRMYGIQGAEVIDQASILHPVIQADETILPQKEFTIKVKEQSGRPMTYTLAIVDEGLLDINGFKTPDAWRAMNRKEALGVDTWDLYDDVIGAYAGKFTSVLKVGGDEALRAAAGKEKRFNPVVKFLGPFTSDGSTKVHQITLPMYVGSVRVMVVAAHQGAYGSAEKNITVKSPLMLLTTLPRTLSCGDKVEMPVNLFVMEEGINDVTLSVETDGPVVVAGSASQAVKFDNPSEKIVGFKLMCDSKATGKATITIKAACGEHSAVETVHMDIRNPHPQVVTVEHKVLGSGSGKFSWKSDQDGSISLEAASMPSVNFSGIMAFVQNYSHYCTEQLSSRAMFLLYGRKFLSNGEQVKAENSIREILKVLSTRQMPNGGFRYWDTSTEPHLWATSMVGEVMVEARNQGFAVHADMLDKWITFQSAQAMSYTHITDRGADQQQAYRLYTLVLAGQEPTAAMNRLKEAKSISSQAKYRLAAAYKLAGKDAVAESVMDKESIEVDGDHRTFWSSLRDEAMKLETLVLLDRFDLAMPLAKELADSYPHRGHVTQEVAFVSSAFSRLSDALGDGLCDVTVSYADKEVEVEEASGIENMNIPVEAGEVIVKNNGGKPVYLSLTNAWQPSSDEIVHAMASGASVSVSYSDVNGNPVDVKEMKQGTEFHAEFKVRKKDDIDSESMALTFALPSGWEILNDRIHGVDEAGCTMDIRDDRVCMYFRLNSLESKSFKVRLRAAYEGEYIFPATVLEDMYRADCRATTSSSTVKVVK
jgi:uncharacterized protein YfaS (alpha-2-macroglobulin family)